MKGRPIDWQPEELAWIEARKDWPRADLHRAFITFWKRPEICQQALSALCKRQGWLTGRTGVFVKGQAPMNKGQKMPFNPNSAATRFKKGTPPPNQLPLWSERIGKDGYTEMKVPARNPWTGHPTRFYQKHRWLWQQLHGPVPKGMALKSIDGNRLNTDPSNWTLVSKSLLPRLNGKSGRDYDHAPDEVKPTIMAVAKLEQAARDRRSKVEIGSASATSPSPGSNP